MVDNRNTKIGGAEFKDIKDSNVNIGNVDARVTAGGDIVGGNKITHYHFYGEVTEAKPFLPNEPPYFEPETIIIPAGPFIMGSNHDEFHEAPQHTVDLAEFRIGIYPVTNRQYFAFISLTERVVDPVLLWDGNQPPKDKLNYPVTGVTWSDFWCDRAEVYVAFRSSMGKSLAYH
jgi:formylglycine-generating enzyme required for sulfatase activity